MQPSSSDALVEPQEAPADVGRLGPAGPGGGDLPLIPALWGSAAGPAFPFLSLRCVRGLLDGASLLPGRSGSPCPVLTWGFPCLELLPVVSCSLGCPTGPQNGHRCL